MGKTFSTGLLTDGIAQDSSNNIGIGGAVNASYKLAVTGATSITTGSGTKAFSMNGASTGYQYMEMVNTGGSLNMGIASSAGAFWGSGGGGNYYSAIGTSNATDFVIGTNNAGRMIVTSSGNVTINGAIETYAKLNVKPTNNQIYGGAAFYSTDGTETFLGIGNIGTAVGLEATYGSTGSYVPMIFKTGGTERMRITSAGQIYNSNAPNGDWAMRVIANSSTNSSYGLKVLGGTTNLDAAFQVTNQVGSINYFYVRGDGLLVSTPLISTHTTSSGANIYVDPSNGAIYRSTSSLKYKKNVQDYTKGLDIVMQLRPVSYEGKSEIDAGLTFAGLIAEEVHDLGLTEYVQYAEDGTPDALAYQNMIALLTKAIQELSAKVTALENK